MIKGGGDRVVDWIWRSLSVVSEDWRSAMIVLMYKGNGQRNECKNYRGISSLSVVGKIYMGILVDTVRRATGGLIDDEQGNLQQGGSVQIRPSH